MDGAPRKKRADVLRSLRGRFHEDPAREPTSYAGESLLTAWLEVGARLGHARANPAVWKAWRLLVRGGRFADLRKARIRRTCDVRESDLYKDPWPPECRATARRLRKRGFSGLIYKSVRNRPRGVCVALFLERASKQIKLAPLDEEDWSVFHVEMRRPKGGTS